MNDEICYGDRRQGSVMAYQRNYSSPNGNLSRLEGACAADARNELESLEKNLVDAYPQIGLSKSLQKNIDIMTSSSASSSALSTSASSSGMKRLNQHRNHHHHSKHQKSINGHHKKGSHAKSQQKRFCRTASALKQAGLLELTLQTAQLVQKNDQIQKEIDSLQEQTIQFSKALQEQLEEKLRRAKHNV